MPPITYLLNRFFALYFILPILSIGNSKNKKETKMKF